MDENRKSFGKRELILLITVFIVSALFYFFNQLWYAKPAAIVEVSVIDAESNKIVLETFSLSENTEYTIVTEPIANGEADGINHLIIQEGEAWISEANCPNHDCVKKGRISQNGEMLICIPHRLTITILDQ